MNDGTILVFFERRGKNLEQLDAFGTRNKNKILLLKNCSTANCPCKEEGCKYSGTKQQFFEGYDGFVDPKMKTGIWISSAGKHIFAEDFAYFDVNTNNWKCKLCGARRAQEKNIYQHVFRHFAHLMKI
eukprot:174919_1